LFAKNSNEVGLINDASHSIQLKNKSTIISVPNRRVPWAHEGKLQECIRDLLEKGIIQHSSSPFNSPIVIVPKKDNTIRLCVDYRKLNEATIKQSFYFPDTIELFDRLGGNTFFTTLDMQKGYYQLKMDKESIAKTAFSCSEGHFEFLRMPFGLCNAPCTFQNAIQTILRNENNKTCLIYLDDIIIFANTIEEHNKRLKNIFSKLLAAGIKLSFNKCQFAQKRVKFLGHIISKNGIETDPEKTKIIKEWKKPETMRELTSFMGFTSYYRRFIKNFSSIAEPIECIMKRAKQFKNKKIAWTEEMAQSFQKLKEELCTAPVLNSPNKTDLFILDTDASQSSVGAVLSQRNSDGQEKVVAYASNRLSKCETKYCATRKELLAVVHYVRLFRHYLIGKKFLLRTDHKSLTWLMSWKNPSSSQYYSWISELSQYDFEIEHRAGKEHTNADILSRLQHSTDCKQCQVNVNEKELFRISKLSVPPIQGARNVKTITKNEGQIIAEKIHKQFCHIGYKKLVYCLKEHYIWKGMDSDCKRICSSCIICLKRKSIKTSKHEPGHLSASAPLEKVFIDIAGPLPECQGYKYILGIIDCFTRFMSLIPLRTITSKEICEKFYQKWITLFGPPSYVHSDQGPNFNSIEISRLCERFGIKKTKTAPFHPQSNGMVERTFRCVKDMLFCCNKESGRSWVESIPDIEMVLRHSLSSPIHCTPSELLFGRKSSLIKSLPNRPNNFCLPDKLSNQLIDQCGKLMLDITEPNEIIKEGDHVMVKILPVRKSIYNPRFDGPYPVVRVKSKGRFIVCNKGDGKLCERNICDVKLAPKPSENNRERPTYEAISAPANQYSDQITQETAPTITPTTTNRYPTRHRLIPKRYGYSS